MVQDILTYLVILATVVYTGYKVVLSIRPSKKGTTACGTGCSCSSDKLKSEVTKG